MYFCVILLTTIQKGFLIPTVELLVNWSMPNTTENYLCQLFHITGDEKHGKCDTGTGPSREQYGPGEGIGVDHFIKMF